MRDPELRNLRPPARRSPATPSVFAIAAELAPATAAAILLAAATAGLREVLPVPLATTIVSLALLAVATRTIRTVRRDADTWIRITRARSSAVGNRADLASGRHTSSPWIERARREIESAVPSPPLLSSTAAAGMVVLAGGVLIAPLASASHDSKAPRSAEKETSDSRTASTESEAIEHDDVDRELATAVHRATRELDGIRRLDEISRRLVTGESLTDGFAGSPAGTLTRGESRALERASRALESVAPERARDLRRMTMPSTDGRRERGRFDAPVTHSTEGSSLPGGLGVRSDANDPELIGAVDGPDAPPNANASIRVAGVELDRSREREAPAAIELDIQIDTLRRRARLESKWIGVARRYLEKNEGNGPQ